MGKLDGLTIVKLGGSLITEKDRSLTPNIKNIDAAAKEIAKSDALRRGPLFIIHGGGSYGHYYADKFGLSKAVKKYPADAMAKTAQAMIELHSIVLKHLNAERLNCKSILISEFLSEDAEKLTSTGLKCLERIYRSNMVPLSFGNIFISKGGSMIVSGDQIALALARVIRTKRVIFAMDVDGIYPRQNLRQKIIDVIDESIRIESISRRYDVTGGIVAKIKAGFELRDLGASVFYVSGQKKHRLQGLLSGRSDVVSTKIYSSQNRPD